ncbi:trypsin-like serine protease [Clostridium estertheticum]|uniref:P-loop NTPase n=1 Tax=Clostridium estertheticum TaxID=238834 RepID=UPI001C0B341F|nr:trypsin-like serine protease [Clostridium estertheticum]MBU3175379.1 trypsin-like serine protease [Clostridium estertheticum]
MGIEEKLRLITVRIEAKVDRNQRNSILGSGVLWFPDEKSKYIYVLTAAHVVYGYSELVIRYWNEGENSKTINIADDNIAMHEQNNYSEHFREKRVLLKNDVAVLRCSRESIAYPNYKLKVVRDIVPEEALILRGFPTKIDNDEDSITLGIEIKAEYSMADAINKFFCYKIEEPLKCEEKNEELEGLSGSGIFLKNEPLTLIGIHSYGVGDVAFNRVTGMNIELVRDICQMKKWDIPKVSSNAEKTHTIPSIYNWEEINDDFLKNHSKYNDERLKDFLKGQKCTWGLIGNNCTIKREVTETVIVKILTKKIIGILGAGGEGKSTILMQVCKELNNIGYTVYWNTEQIKKTLYNMELKSTTDSVVLVIDDASGDVEFEKFALQAANKGYKIIFAARENEWKMGRMRSESAELEREAELIELKKVTEAEAVKFAHLIVVTMNIDTKESEIQKIFTENNNGFLLAAMLMVVYGRPLEEIVKDILLKIKKESENVLKVLAIICFIEELESRVKKNINITSEIYRVLYSSYGIKKKEINVILHKEVQKTNLSIIRTRHPIISNIILEFLIRREDAEFEVGDLLYDFITCFYKVENNKGKKTMPIGIYKSVYPMMREILNDVYINNITQCQDIAIYITEMYSTRGDIWILWAGIARNQDNVGQDVDEEYGARWILKKASEKCPLYGNIYLKWAEIEIEQNNVGADINEENSARWILKEGTKKCLSDENIYIKEAELEIEQDNLGQDISEENSARWILKEGTKNCNAGGNIYLKWAEVEIKENNVGAGINEENSARWILKQGSRKHPFNNGNNYIKWAQLEIKQENIGRDINEENSARWILKQGIEKCPLDGNIYMYWAELEIEQNNIGKDINEENSARWILKQGIKKCPLFSNNYIRWAEMELKQDNIGQDIFEENSVRWILSKCLSKNVNLEYILMVYSKIEVNFNNDEKAINMLIESLKFSDKNLWFLALLQAKNNNFSPQDPYSAKKCIDMMVKSCENSRNIYIAYLCYELYISEEIGERYKERLSQTDIEIFEQEKVFKIKQWEEGWIKRSKLEQI